MSTLTNTNPINHSAVLAAFFLVDQAWGSTYLHRLLKNIAREARNTLLEYDILRAGNPTSFPGALPANPPPENMSQRLQKLVIYREVLQFVCADPELGFTGSGAGEVDEEVDEDQLVKTVEDAVWVMMKIDERRLERAEADAAS